MAGFFVAFLANAAEFDHQYASLHPVLSRHVREGQVDYAALKANPGPLNAALDEFASVRRAVFEAWSQPQQMAFLINLYNASTLKLIVDHYPVRSIKDIGHILRGPFKQKAVRVFGETTTLDFIEHGMLRANYREPRVHFALVCAAKSCPPLRPEPYVADRLDAQLRAQGQLFLGARDKNRFDTETGVLHLSPIFKWFKEDFGTEHDAVVKFVTPLFPDDTRRQIESSKAVNIRFTDYDWTLNEQPR